MVTLPSWDLFIGLFFVINLAYSLILQRDKVLLTLISTYVALIISQNFSTIIGQLFIGDKTILGGLWIKSSASPFIIQTTLYALTIVILTTKSGLGGNSGRRGGLLSPLEVIVYSFFTSALIISTILSFLPETDRDIFLAQSQIAKIIMDYHLWWLALPPVSLIVTGMRSSSHNSILS